MNNLRFYILETESSEEEILKKRKKDFKRRVWKQKFKKILKVIPSLTFAAFMFGMATGIIPEFLEKLLKKKQKEQQGQSRTNTNSNTDFNTDFNDTFRGSKRYTYNWDTGEKKQQTGDNTHQFKGDNPYADPNLREKIKKEKEVQKQNPTTPEYWSSFFSEKEKEYSHLPKELQDQHRKLNLVLQRVVLSKGTLSPTELMPAKKQAVRMAAELKREGDIKSLSQYFEWLKKLGFIYG